MAQVLRRMWAVWLLVAMVAACKPWPHSFDNIPDQQARPPAHQSGYPYNPNQPQNGQLLPQPGPYDQPPSKTVKVGLLVPLSGRSESMGKALRDASILALFDKYAVLSGSQASIRVELVPKDTKGTPSGARQAAAEAVQEGAQLLVGPLFSQSVEAIKPLAKTGKISIITFSNNAEIAGDGVFTIGFNPDEQARRIANYVFSRDINRMAVLAPNTPYGRQVMKAVDGVAELLGRKTQPSIRYSPSGGSLKDDVKRLAVEGSVGARVGFEALFLPEGGDKLGMVLKRLSEHNITPRNVQFVGTGLWDDRDMIRLYDLQGAWLASSPPQMYEAFEQRFINTYNYKPPRIASLAYDAVALAATLATNDEGFHRSVFTNPNGYSGPANGIFRFRKNGMVERGLAVMEVGNGGFKVIDPAPTSFQ